MDEGEIFTAFAKEVRGSYDILLNKLKAIKMSTDEAKLRREYLDAETEENTTGEESVKPVKRVQPQTPATIRILFRSVTKDVVRLREAFKVLSVETVSPQEIQQLERIIKDLERQLTTRTTELENLQAAKLGRGKSARAKTARRSARSVPPVDPIEVEIPKPAEQPPSPVRKAVNPGCSREKRWGEFHGQNTLTRNRTDLSLKLPSACTSSSLVSSRSQSSDEKYSMAMGGQSAPTVNQQNNNRGLFTSLRKQPSMTTRLGNGSKERAYLMSGALQGKRQSTWSGPAKFQRELTNLEKVDMNRQFGQTVMTKIPEAASGITAHNHPPSRNRKVTDVNSGHKNARPARTSVVGFGSSYKQLPPVNTPK